VNSAVLTERNHQDVKFPGGKTLDQHVELLNQFSTKAAATADPIEKLGVIREIAGIAHRAMEEHGAPLRPITGVMDAHTKSDSL
jgi:hypothetical protein